MSPPHIVMTADCVGGVWQYATDLADGLAANGYRVTLALMGPAPSERRLTALRGGSPVRVVETGLPLDWLAKDAGEIVDASRALIALASDLGADLVQLNSPALACAGPFPIPTVGVLHSCLASWWSAMRDGSMPEDFVWRTDLLARGLAQCGLVVTPTRAFGDRARQIYKLGVEPATVHNGRAFLPAPPQGMHDHVFTAGRLWDEAKGARLLDRVAARLSVPFFAAGGTRRPHGEEAAFDALSLLGHLDGKAIARRLAARPIFASAARYEPFGLSVLEAAMAGCALVLSDIPTFRELWSDAALFVAPDDQDGFVDAIETLIGEAGWRLQLGDAARRRSAAYGADRMVREMAAHYARLLSDAPRPAKRKAA